MMDLPFCHMHGPEHHALVGAALLTAYKNAGGDLDLESALGRCTAGAGPSPAGPAASGAPTGRGSARGGPGRRGLRPGAPGGELARSVPVCTCSARNGQCIGRRCPFSAVR